jgi:hypothetical protein
MVEGNKGKKYGGLIDNFNIVEENMKYSREEVERLLNKGEVVM